MYSNKFVAEAAGISLGYFQDIIMNRYFVDTEYEYVPRTKLKSERC